MSEREDFLASVLPRLTEADTTSLMAFYDAGRREGSFDDLADPVPGHHVVAHDLLFGRSGGEDQRPRRRLVIFSCLGRAVGGAVVDADGAAG